MGDDNKYFPNAEERDILIPKLKVYFTLPKRSSERKCVVKETFDLLQKLKIKGDWNEKKVRLWFNNNQKLQTINNSEHNEDNEKQEKLNENPQVDPAASNLICNDSITVGNSIQKNDDDIKFYFPKICKDFNFVNSDDESIIQESPKEIKKIIESYEEEEEEITDKKDKMPEFPLVPEKPNLLDDHYLYKHENYSYLKDLLNILDESYKRYDEKFEEIEKKFVECINQMHEKLKIECISYLTQSKQVCMNSNQINRKLTLTSEKYAHGGNTYRNEPIVRKCSEDFCIENDSSIKDMKKLHFYDCKKKLTKLACVQSYTFDSFGNLAYVYLNGKKNSLMIHYKEKENYTGFFDTATSMAIDNLSKKIWIQADCRVKSFNIETLENIDTFFVSSQTLSCSCITIWKNYVVLSSSNQIYLWDTNDLNEKENDILMDKYNEKSNQFLNNDNINWVHGINSNNNFSVDFPTGVNITSICSVGNVLAVASENYPVIYLLNDNGKIVGRLIGHVEGITSLLAKDDKFLFSGSNDMIVKLWNIETCELIINFAFHQGPIISLALISIQEMELLFSCGSDNIIYAWDIKNKKSIFNISCKTKNKYDEKQTYLTPLSISYDNIGSSLNVLYVDNNETNQNPSFLPETIFVNYLCSK